MFSDIKSKVPSRTICHVKGNMFLTEKLGQITQIQFRLLDGPNYTKDDSDYTKYVSLENSVSITFSRVITVLKLHEALNQRDIVIGEYVQKKS